MSSSSARPAPARGRWRRGAVALDQHADHALGQRGGHVAGDVVEERGAVRGRAPAAPGRAGRWRGLGLRMPTSWLSHHVVEQLVVGEQRPPAVAQLAGVVREQAGPQAAVAQVARRARPSRSLALEGHLRRAPAAVPRRRPRARPRLAARASASVSSPRSRPVPRVVGVLVVRAHEDAAGRRRGPGRGTGGRGRPGCRCA